MFLGATIGLCNDALFGCSDKARQLLEQPIGTPGDIVALR